MFFSLCCYLIFWNTQLKSYHRNQSNTWAKSFVSSERREQKRWNYSILREAKMQNFSSHQNQQNFISAQSSKSKQEVMGTKLKIKITLNCYLCGRVLKYNSTHNFWLSEHLNPLTLKIMESTKEHHFEEGESNLKTELLAGLHPVPRSLNPRFSTLTICDRALCWAGPLSKYSNTDLKQGSFSTSVLQELRTILVVILERPS